MRSARLEELKSTSGAIGIYIYLYILSYSLTEPKFATQLAKADTRGYCKCCFHRTPSKDLQGKNISQEMRRTHCHQTKSYCITCVVYLCESCNKEHYWDHITRAVAEEVPRIPSVITPPNPPTRSRRKIETHTALCGSRMAAGKMAGFRCNESLRHLAHDVLRVQGLRHSYL